MDKFHCSFYIWDALGGVAHEEVYCLLGRCFIGTSGALAGNLFSTSVGHTESDHLHPPNVRGETVIRKKLFCLICPFLCKWPLVKIGQCESILACCIQELSSRPRNNSSDRGRHQTHLLNTYASTSSQSRKGPSLYPQKRPSHQPTVSHGKSSANSSKKVKTENTVYSKNSEEVEKPPQNSTVDFAQSQGENTIFRCKNNP